MAKNKKTTMKQLNLSLTDGFKLRSLIKRKIGIVNSDINSLPVSYDPDLEGKKIEFLCGKYGSVNQMIDLCLKLQETLGYLNEKIDKANIDVRPLLDKTETLNAQNSTVGRILSCIQMNAQSVKKEFNPVTGVYDVTELSQTFADGKIKAISR